MTSVYPHDLGVSDTLVPQQSAKTELVLNILEDELGDQTRRVASVLMATYHCTLSHLVRHFSNKAQSSSNLTPSEVRGSLVVLQQYRCLVVERPPARDIVFEGPAALDNSKHMDNVLVYSIDSDMVVNRLRSGRAMYRARAAASSFNIPTYVSPSEMESHLASKGPSRSGGSSSSSSSSSSGSVVQKPKNAAHSASNVSMWGDVAELVMEDLLMHGRIALQQVLLDAVGTMEQQLTASLRMAAESSANGAIVLDAEDEHATTAIDEGIKKQVAEHRTEWRFLVYHVFSELIKHRLITRVRRVEALRQQAFVKTKAVRGPKARPTGQNSAAEEAAGAGRMSTAQRMGVKRPKSNQDDEHDNQLPDEMMDAENPSDTFVPAASSAAHPTDASAHSSSSSSSSSATPSSKALRNMQVDAYAVIEARSGSEDEGFGPISEEILVDSAASGRRATKVPLKTLDIKSEGIHFAESADLDTAAATTSSKRPAGRARKGSSSSAEGDIAAPTAEADSPVKVARKKRARAEDTTQADTKNIKSLKGAIKPEQPVEVEEMIDVAGDIAYLARKNVLWTVNWEQLVELERIGTCVRYTRERLKEKAARVVRIILEESLHEENVGAVADNLCYLQRFTTEALTPTGEAATCIKAAATETSPDDYTYNELPCIDVEASEAARIRRGYFNPVQCLEYSRPVDLMRIINAYTRGYVSPSVGGSASNHEATATFAPKSDSDLPDGTEKERVLDISTLRKLLDVLVADTSLGTSRAFGASGEQTEYVVNIKSMISALQRKTITSIARGRYGVQTARLVELMLSRDEWMEQSALGDIAIMPAREAREKLYLLYRDNWIDFREVSKRSDYNPQSTYYFWKIDYQHVRSVVLDHSYRGLLNLRIKRASLVREAGEKEIELQTLALYKEIATGEVGAQGQSAKPDGAFDSSGVGGAADGSAATAAADTKSTGVIVLVDGGDASASTSVGGAFALTNNAAMAVHRGCIVRAEEKISQARLGTALGAQHQMAPHMLGIDVAIGRLDLAIHNIDLTIMVMDRM